jgi:drug/metabolite transporter (DMT)-like permease
MEASTRLPPWAAVLGVAFAFAASACWGTADFFGGLFSRRLPIPVVLFVVQASGLVLVAAMLVGAGSSPPGGRAALAGLFAGAAGISALAAFYRALAIGTMSIVAPVSATGVALPVVVGVATGESLSTVVAVGLAITVAGVMVASREAGEHGDAPPAGSRASIGLALLAALGFGTFFIAYDVAADGSVLWAMLLVRLAGLPVLGLLAAVSLRQAGPPAPGDLRALAGCGLIDVSAVGLYALANTHADLAVVSVVGSMYPLATIALARGVLGERIRPSQAAGIVAALGGVALIAAG